MVSINIAFICTGKPKNSYDSLYCDIRFTVGVGNHTRTITEVWLYKQWNKGINKREADLLTQTTQAWG